VKDALIATFCVTIIRSFKHRTIEVVFRVGAPFPSHLMFISLRSQSSLGLQGSGTGFDQNVVYRPGLGPVRLHNLELWHVS